MSDTKEYIIDQAYNLFLTRSYEAVSISDISNAIGFTKGALYHHFKNKEELFKAVVDKYFVFYGVDADLENTTLRQFNELSINTIKKIVNQIFVHGNSFDPINYMSILVDSFRHYPGFEEDRLDFFRQETRKTEVILEKAKERGEIRSDIDCKLWAATYFSITIGFAGSLLQKFSVDETVVLLKQQIDELYKILKV
jgi:TetR/AcrR family transcriptional regulator, transcriptional repressor for nem operon